VLTILATAALTAMLTAAVTFALARYLYLNRIHPRIVAAINERLEQMGDVIEDRVRRGVVKAVEDVASPEGFQKRMSKGQDTLMDVIFGQRGKRDE